MKNNKIKEILNQLNLIFKKFPITFIIIAFLTIFHAIIIDTNYFSNTFINNISIFSIIFAISTFFIETVFKSKSLKVKIIFYNISFLFSISYTYALNYKDSFLTLSNTKYLNYLYRFIICYILCAFIYSIYSLYKEKDININEYLLKVVIYRFKTFVMYLLLSTGVLLISLVFITLILEKQSFVLISRVLILIFGLFYVPRSLYSLTAPDEKIGPFSKVIIKYVLGTLVLLSFFVIYLYIFKIFIQMQLPKNQIFRITAALFIIGCPIWILVSYYKDNDIFSKINNALAYAFIPFIFLQMYSIGIRIFEYGVTPLRYICIILIIFEIIYIITHHFDKDRLNKIFITSIILILITLIFPFINMFKISEISQINIIKSFVKDTSKNLNKEEKGKARSAYNYLIDTSEGKKLINSILTKEEKDKLFEEDIENTYNYKTLYGSKNIVEINLEGYKTLYEIDENIDRNLEKDFKMYQFNIGNNRVIKEDISKLIEKYQSIEEHEFDEFFENNNEYIINSEVKIILKNFSITFNEDTKDIRSCYFEGYILKNKK